MLRTTFIAFLSLCLWIPALSQDGMMAEKWKAVNIPFNYKNIQVPREFWDFVKEKMRQDGVKESVIEDFGVLPISVKTEIYSEDPGILKDSMNYSLQYVEGGGSVDFFDYLTGKGDFHFRFVPEFPEEGQFYIFYISDSPGKMVQGDQWGNGCGKIYNLSQQAELWTGLEGVRVTASRRHYLHLAAGTFVFAQLVDERLHLGYIRIGDSRYPNFNCREA